MKIKAILPLVMGLAITFHALPATGQYTPRPGSPEALEGSPAGLGLAFVTHLDGESVLMSTDDEDWVALSPNLSLRIGDRIWVQDSPRSRSASPWGRPPG
jgi:hypothetical protein